MCTHLFLLSINLKLSEGINYVIRENCAAVQGSVFRHS